MSRKILYAAFAVMGFRVGVYALVIAFKAIALPEPYVDIVGWTCLCALFILAVVMVVLGFLGGCKYVAGWSWWDVLVMLAIGAAGVVFPSAIISWQTEMLWLFWKCL